jgi:quercetin dioxygenase-like cupin family protein
MIHARDAIENPVTGEKILFRRTSAETNGELVVIECTVEPDGAVAMAHVHPSQDERFEILEGTVLFRRGKESIRAEAADVVTIPAGTPHHFENVGDEAARFVTEIRPALGFEQMVETMFALARDGKVNRRGMPNPLRLAVIARHYFDTVQLPFPPVWMQRAGLALGAPIGRLAGYRPTYESTAGLPTLEAA